MRHYITSSPLLWLYTILWRLFLVQTGRPPRDIKSYQRLLARS
jgi:hypothetical protein